LILSSKIIPTKRTVDPENCTGEFTPKLRKRSQAVPTETVSEQTTKPANKVTFFNSS
jgi:hypothetical protein